VIPCSCNMRSIAALDKTIRLVICAMAALMSRDTK
jgi:hypothetical protein